MTIPDGIDSPLGALSVLRERVAALRLPLQLHKCEQARQTRKDIVAQLDDYVLPRTARIDAPLLAVVGGSTGAGKSTLVNALAGREVSQTGVLRPTTRSPVLVYNPAEAAWFESNRILPGLTRVGDGVVGKGVLRMVPMETVPPGLALLDAPDVDSVVDENRELGTQLLHAADLWLFMTTAARYADAVPWGFLYDAARRSAAISVVLNRVPKEGIDEVRQDLAALLDNHGLGDTPMFVIEETVLDGGALPRTDVEPIASWLASLAGDATARATVIYRTLDGAVADMLRRAPELAAFADMQASMADQLRGSVLSAYDDALRAIGETTRGGRMLRGELLARWQQFIGTGELGYSLDEGVGRTRDRVVAFLRPRPPLATGVEEAIGRALETLFVSEADGASHHADSRWRGDPAGLGLLGKSDLSRSSPDLPDRVREQVGQWQAATVKLINDELEGQRYDVRVPSFGVSGLGVSLMVVALCTGEENGADVPRQIAGGTTVVGVKLLEAVFGDKAVRRLTDAARQDLEERARALLNAEAARFTERLDVLALDPGASVALRDAVHGVEHALREAEPEWRWEAGWMAQQTEQAAQQEGSP